ncbi:MAG TPA: phospholipase D-like domain-containing protein [Patescibacteria group bacterium]|jgi:phosphatidylserine/phosphatidylglycerophosphate/cardiolipin synthase-like enzyme|nr:phospholipase D-like domain-containing protein [Patescibacteria group bacterium]
MKTDDFKLYSRIEYIQTITDQANKLGHGDRILVTSMYFDPKEPPINHLIDALCLAAKRGAEVTLIIDAFTFLWQNDREVPGPAWSGKKISTSLRQPFGGYAAKLETLAECGGHYAITNLPDRRFKLPQSGRSHLKLAIVNDQSYIGGNNLGHVEHMDLMISLKDRTTSDWLYEQFQKIAATKNTRIAFDRHDQQFEVDNQTKIFIDAGVPRQSIIFEKALQLVDDAKEWVVITCQYFPGSKMAQHLLAAHKRGVSVRILFSHPAAHGRQAPLHHINVLREKLRLPAEFFDERLPKQSPLLHAKLIATEQGAIIGSHNYVVQGVNLGTSEIAILRFDKAFAKRAVDKIINQIAS